MRTSLPPPVANRGLRPRVATAACVFRLTCLLFVLVTGAPSAFAQLIPWSEPPALTPTGKPAVLSRHDDGDRPRRRTAPAKKPRAEEIAVAIASPDEWPLFQALATPPSILLSGFDSEVGSGSVRTNTSWVGNVTQNATSITVAGNASDDNGWGASGLSLDATGMSYLTVTAQRDTSNQTPTLFIQFEDRNSHTKVYSLSTSLFAVGTPTTVSLPLNGWTIDFGASEISAWSIGGGSVGTVAFRMTFDELGFTASAIPEPAAVGLLVGLAALGAVALRRRRRGRLAPLRF